MSDAITHGRRLLVVDDNEDSTEMLAELLTLHGYAPRVASTGAAALAAMQEQPADIVLLDLGLPDIDGFEVARQIRARFGAAPFIVVLSGQSQHSARSAAQAAGCDRFVVKPLNADHLTQLLSTAGDRRATS